MQLDGRNNGEFTEDDEAILTQLAHMAAVAVQNAQLYEELRTASHRKNEFLATLAHELRNPLAPIRYSLELMQLSENEPAVQQESRTIISRQVAQMVRLIDDLLDVSRISRGKIELRQEFVTLQSVVAAAREASGPIIADYEHEFTVDMPAEPIWVHADPTRLAQVLLNVLNNAAKYTPVGGKIALEVTKGERDVAIHVRDNGVGIPADMLGQVFEMFTQVDRSLERSSGGLGIGLTLVRRLIELHGGTIEARMPARIRGASSSFAFHSSPKCQPMDPRQSRWPPRPKPKFARTASSPSMTTKTPSTSWPARSSSKDTKSPRLMMALRRSTWPRDSNRR